MYHTAVTQAVCGGYSDLVKQALPALCVHLLLQLESVERCVTAGGHGSASRNAIAGTGPCSGLGTGVGRGSVGSYFTDLSPTA